VSRVTIAIKICVILLIGIFVESVAVDDSLDGCETQNIVKNCVEDDRKWDSWKARMFLASSMDRSQQTRWSFEYCRRS
jgi:hypothetical protein